MWKGGGKGVKERVGDVEEGIEDGVGERVDGVGWKIKVWAKVWARVGG